MKFEDYKINGYSIKIPIPEGYRDCIKIIQSDFYRLNGRTEPFFKIVAKIIKPFGSSVLFWFRLCQYRGVFFFFFHQLFKRACKKSHVEIPISTKVGYGLYLGHGFCIVVNGGTIIGNNVNLSQFVNIGSNNDSPAMIGDDVYIGPHVSIVENVIIGCKSTIGAGAVIVKDVPDNATAAGVPGKVLNFNNPGRFIRNRFCCD